MKKEAFAHITEMENILNIYEEKLKALLGLVEFFQQNRADYEKLITYYTSEQRRQDVAMDEQQLIPEDLPRGVLGEDYLWNMMIDYQEMGEELIALGQLMTSNVETTEEN